ncbi:MAG TPA: hypothetical protein VK906_16345 [Egicoccus sp.]|nr:hypothetical protein [Egicoccus sp.]HSK24757.1 hypothetical protein [Egicoccus sp.]
MRRLLGLLAPALLLVSLLAAPTAAFAAPEPTVERVSEPTIVLAAAATDPTGPEPADRLEEDNPARTLGGYEDRDVQFTWGAAWILLAAGALGVTLLAGLYYLLVHRPARESAEH